MPEPTTTRATRDVVSFVKRGVRLLEPYSLTVEPHPVKLNQNESPWDVPEEMKQAIVERVLAIDWSRYPSFYPFPVAQQIAALNGVPESSVLAGSGSNELTLSFMTAVMRQGDEVVFCVPTFPLYGAATHVLEGKVVPVPLRADFSPDVDAVIEKARRPRVKLVFICSPNNPTGGLWTEAQLRAVLDATECLVVVDEAYCEFAGTSFAPLLATEPRLVLLRTFSKAMAMAGLRIGYLLGNPDLMYEVSKVRLPYSINVFAQETAMAMLSRADLVRRRVAEVRAERERVRQAAARLPGVEVFPSQANFLLMRFRDGAQVYQDLRGRGVLVRDVARYPMLANCLRVTVGQPAENDIFLAALAETVTSANGGTTA